MTQKMTQQQVLGLSLPRSGILQIASLTLERVLHPIPREYAPAGHGPQAETAVHLFLSCRLFNAQLRGARIDELGHAPSFVHLAERSITEMALTSL